MEEKFYVAINENERQGPYTITQLDGHITPETLVWNRSLPTWVEAKEVKQLNRLFENKENGEVVFAPPKSYLFPSLLVFFICSFIFGAIAVFYASKVDDLYLKGEEDAALEYSKKARITFIIGIFVGLLLRPILIGSLFFNPLKLFNL